MVGIRSITQYVRHAYLLTSRSARRNITHICRFPFNCERIALNIFHFSVYSFFEILFTNSLTPFESGDAMFNITYVLFDWFGSETCACVLASIEKNVLGFKSNQNLVEKVNWKPSTENIWCDCICTRFQSTPDVSICLKNQINGHTWPCPAHKYYMRRHDLSSFLSCYSHLYTWCSIILKNKFSRLFLFCGMGGCFLFSPFGFFDVHFWFCNDNFWEFIPNARRNQYKCALL